MNTRELKGQIYEVINELKKLNLKLKDIEALIENEVEKLDSQEDEKRDRLDDLEYQVWYLTKEIDSGINEINYRVGGF